MEVRCSLDTQMEMESLEAHHSPNPIPQRHKCFACYKQYKKKEHLVQHMKEACHSVHQPVCGACRKHCKSFESLREHLSGPLAKHNCSMVFSHKGCDICLKVFNDFSSLDEHKETCSQPKPASLGPIMISSPQFNDVLDSINGNGSIRPIAIAMGCKMVGGGSDGTLNLCAQVCLIDENENLIFHAYVQPQIAVTNYRFELTGLTEDHLKDGMPLKEVREKILEILYNEEPVGRVRLYGGKGRLLVGHDLDHYFECLKMSYPDHLLRDTAKYHPLMKTNLVSHSLKYLTKQYLGYDIQTWIRDPYKDCVSVMRLYKRMRDQEHQSEEGLGRSPSLISVDDAAFDPWSMYSSCKNNGFSNWSMEELNEMSPDELYKISRSDYQCWCLDLKRGPDSSE